MCVLEPDQAHSNLIRLRLTIAYDGTDFAGWAPQQGQRTIAGELNRIFSTIFHYPVRLVGAGRTDTGVHACGQTAHFDVPEETLRYIRPQGPRPPQEPEFQPLLIRLARFVPADIRILTISRAPNHFDARFSALRRHYTYRLSTALYGVLPHEARYVTAWSHPLDIEAMNKASQSLLGIHNFAAFCRHRPGATTIRDLQQFIWSRNDTLITARVSADAFCWSMVRSLVGALLAVGEHRRPISWCTNLLSCTSRSSDFSVAPARGLTLTGVDYPPDEDLDARNIRTRNLRLSSEITRVSPQDSDGLAIKIEPQTEQHD